MARNRRSKKRKPIGRRVTVDGTEYELPSRIPLTASQVDELRSVYARGLLASQRWRQRQDHAALVELMAAASGAATVCERLCGPLLRPVDPTWRETLRYRLGRLRPLRHATEGERASLAAQVLELVSGAQAMEPTGTVH